MDQQYTEKLEWVIKQMLTPLKGIPLNLVMENISWYKIKRFNKDDEKDLTVLKQLEEVAKDACLNINIDWILRTRANEVGNDTEKFIENSLNKFWLKAASPETKKGKRKNVWYPDLEFIDNFWRHNYLECKTYNLENIDSSLRSFYLSPSNDFKVIREAHHYVISLEIYVEKWVWNKNLYKASWWKILSIEDLEVNVKYEFNSDNKKLYSNELILSEWKI